MGTRPLTRETRLEERHDQLDPPGHWNVAMGDRDWYYRHGYQTRVVERFVTDWVEVVE